MILSISIRETDKKGIEAVKEVQKAAVAQGQSFSLYIRNLIMEASNDLRSS